MNICYIVGAGDLHEAKFEFTNRGLLIAADGGYKVLKHAKIAPDFVVGDFDSLKISEAKLLKLIDTIHKSRKGLDQEILIQYK